MEKQVDVAIIGAGTSGLNALSQVKKAGKSFLLINGGYWGTTCARVGCMPSKAFIQVAEDYHRREIFDHAHHASSKLRPYRRPAATAKMKDAKVPGSAAGVKKAR